VGETGEQRWIDVFADAPRSRTQPRINGFVIPAGGGAPRDAVLVRALAGGVEIAAGETDRSGRFSLLFPSSYGGAEVHLEIDSSCWRPADANAMVFRLDKPEQESTIRVVAR
jgi:hypothetical protein